MNAKFNNKKLILIIVGIILSNLIILSFLTTIFFLNFKKTVDESLRFKPSIISIIFKNEIKEKFVYIESIFFRLIPNSGKNKIQEFHIDIKQKDLDLLNSDLPKSGKADYVNGFLTTNNYNDVFSFENEKVKIRYRGNNNFHWFYNQKSLRIKLKNGIKFNLINPQHLFSIIDTVSYNEAKYINLLAPKSFSAKVFINERDYGVYSFVQQIDENFLRENSLMPGSIYFGDRNADDENGLPTLWSDYRSWDKKSSRNKESEGNIDDLKFFIKGVNEFSDRDFYDFFNKYFDKEKVFSSFGIDTLFGTSIRDSRHNHKWYFDPYVGKYQPIIWDIRDWSVGARKDMSTYTFLKRVKSNPILEYERDLASYNNYILDKNKTIERIIDDLNNIYESTLNYLAEDALKDTAVWYSSPINNWISESFTTREYKKSILDHKNILKSRISFLENEYEKSMVTINYKESNDSIYDTVSIVVNGNSPVIITFSKEINLIEDRNLNSEFDSDDYLSNTQIILYPGRKKVFDMPLNYNGYRLEPSGISYNFFIRKDISFEEFINLCIFKNAITDSEVKPVIVQNSPNQSETISIHPWLLPEYEEQTISLSGNQYISSDRVYDQYTTVKILPGTTFYLDPDTSLFFYGKVEANGTLERPIRFIQSVPGKSFGSIVLQGQKTAGSILENIQVEKGSVTSRNLINYTAQLNIHDTKDIILKNCVIGENFVGDDSLHLAYVENAQIDGCIFHSARSDAVDIDISQVELKNNLFINSGNDLLDFMTSEATVKDNIFINGGDKGISVGEWSTLKIEDNFFYSNLIGIEVKDKSDVELIGSNLIVDSKVSPINLYNKNEFYDEGGYIKGEKIYIIGENRKISKDKKSKEKIDNILEKFPNIEKFKILDKFTSIDPDWSNLESSMKKLIRDYPW